LFFNYDKVSIDLFVDFVVFGMD